ncbi:unnamed protein product [Zymoseptoria tritici ST99CH_3D1]|nr:unnamed protein product [Zymoseptoria tritici ST99CH_3D1]
MIDIANAIEVVISPYHETDPYDQYHEWKAPRKSDLYTDGRNECYIEAVDDERFELEARIHPSFDFHGAPQVCISIEIDGGDPERDIIRKPSNWKVKPKILRSQFFAYYCTIAGETRSCGYRFSKLTEVDDTSLLSMAEQELEISRRGKIVVTVQRGTTRGKRVRKEKPGEHVDGLALPDKTNKIVAQDQGRSHAVQPIDLGEGEVEQVEICPQFEPHHKGRTGEEIVFTFFYTNTEYMERNSIKPVVAYPNTSKDSINIKNDAGPVAHQLLDRENTATASLRIENEVNEDGVGEKKTTTHGKTQPEVINLDDDSDTAAPSRPVMGMAGVAPVRVKKEATERNAIPASHGKKRSVIEAELGVAEADWEEAVLDHEAVAKESPGRMALHRACIVKKRRFAELKLQLARLDAEE